MGPCDQSHPLRRPRADPRGIRDTLSDAPDIEVVGEAGDYGMKLRTLLRQHVATCWCWTSTCPAAQRPGRAARAQGRSAHARAGGLDVPRDQYAIRALYAGAFGYVNKGGDPALLVNAVRTVAQGRSTSRPDRADAGRSLTAPVVENSHEEALDRELQTLVLIASGKRLSDIAEELKLSPRPSASTGRRCSKTVAREQLRTDGHAIPAKTVSGAVNGGSGGHAGQLRRVVTPRATARSGAPNRVPTSGKMTTEGPPAAPTSVNKFPECSSTCFVITTCLLWPRPAGGVH